MQLTPREDLVYTYDGSLDGLLSCICAAYEARTLPGRISRASQQQLSLTETVVTVATDEVAARRVEQGILSKIGPEALACVQYAARATDPNAARIALRYVELGFRVGPRLDQRLTEDAVVAMNRVVRAVQWEGHRWLQFLRFGELENGVYYAVFAPEHDVLALVMPELCERFGPQPFLLHDEVRHTAGLWDGRQWQLHDAAHLQRPDYASHEAAYQALWKIFYHSIAVKPRTNLGLRRAFMPKKYWRHIVEMQPDFRTIGEQLNGRPSLKAAALE